jgi:hypothetical protein
MLLSRKMTYRFDVDSTSFRRVERGGWQACFITVDFRARRSS